MLWTGGGLLLVLTALLLLFARPAPPYAFLAGQEPLWRKATKAEPNNIVTLYSFPADVKRLMAEADRELKAEGLIGLTIQWSTRKGDGMRYVRPEFLETQFPWQDPEYISITFIPDTKMTSATQLMTSLLPTERERKKGWITVMIEGARQPTMLERFRAWLGL
jgi:hypothetical protein